MQFDTVDDIRCHHRGFFFSVGAMRSFNSRLLPTVYQGPGGIYFVTSEKFTGLYSEDEPRRYTVRKYDPEADTITRSGQFNKLSRRQAILEARLLASGFHKGDA